MNKIERLWKDRFKLLIIIIVCSALIFASKYVSEREYNPFQEEDWKTVMEGEPYLTWHDDDGNLLFESGTPLIEGLDCAKDWDGVILSNHNCENSGWWISRDDVSNYICFNGYLCSSYRDAQTKEPCEIEEILVDENCCGEYEYDEGGWVKSITICTTEQKLVCGDKIYDLEEMR